MKTLYEGMLADMEDILDKGEEDIKKYETFGYRFTFVSAITSTKAAGMFSVLALKKVTKNINDFINSKVEKSIFDSKQRGQMFVNWIDHMSFKELGIDINKYNLSNITNSNQEVLKVLTNAIRKKCLENDIFNSPKNIDLYVLKNSHTDCFEIFISDRTKYSAQYMMKFVYKINN